MTDWEKEKIESGEWNEDDYSAHYCYIYDLYRDDPDFYNNKEVENE